MCVFLTARNDAGKARDSCGSNAETGRRCRSGLEVVDQTAARLAEPLAHKLGDLQGDLGPEVGCILDEAFEVFLGEDKKVHLFARAWANE